MYIGEYYQKTLSVTKHKTQLGIGTALLKEVMTFLACVYLSLRFYKKNCWNWFSDVCLQKIFYALLWIDTSKVQKLHFFAHRAYK